MANLVVHMLLPLFLVQIYRDHIAKKKFTLNYVLLAGLAGLLPDLDVIVFGIVRLFTKLDLHVIHRTITHTVYFPLLFLILGLILWKVKWKWLENCRLFENNS